MTKKELLYLFEWYYFYENWLPYVKSEVGKDKINEEDSQLRNEKDSQFLNFGLNFKMYIPLDRHS